ncbi:hypothetical protein WI82_09405 [Burkholderia ubonensis]|nr:hypothetical protein WI82_09405 [Burkholderia ubonensis]
MGLGAASARQPIGEKIFNLITIPLNFYLIVIPFCFIWILNGAINIIAQKYHGIHIFYSHFSQDTSNILYCLE